MKMGTILSPWRYDAGTLCSLQSALLRRTAISHYALQLDGGLLHLFHDSRLSHLAVHIRIELSCDRGGHSLIERKRLIPAFRNPSIFRFPMPDITDAIKADFSPQVLSD